MILFGTGHRPEDSSIDSDGMWKLCIQALKIKEPDTIITGMAAGFDLAFAKAAYNLGIEIWTARPWGGHKARVEDRLLYEQIENVAVQHHIISPSISYPGAWCYGARNIFMVNSADEGLCLWNGKQSGGTWNCLKYAAKRKVNVTDVLELGSI